MDQKEIWIRQWMVNDAIPQIVFIFFDKY